MLDALGVAAGEVVEVVVHARHDDRDVAGAGEVAEDLGGAAVAGRVEEQEVAVGVVELEQLGRAQARVVVGHAGRAQARDLAVDRLGVGGVAQADRRAVEVADELRVLLRERLGDGGVEASKKAATAAGSGSAAIRLRGRAAARSTAAAVDRGRGRGAPAQSPPAIWQTAARRRSAICCAGPATNERGDDHRDQQQHPDVLGGDLSALPSQHALERCAGGGPAPETPGLNLKRPEVPLGERDLRP